VKKNELNLERVSSIEEGYFEYGNFEKQSGELKTKWGTKNKHFKQVPNNLAQLKRDHSIP